MKFDDRDDAVSVLGDAIENCIKTKVIKSKYQWGEPDEEGNAPMLAPEVLISGYWLLHDGEADDFEFVAEIVDGQVLSTSDPEIIGCWLSPVPAGWMGWDPLYT